MKLHRVLRDVQGLGYLPVAKAVPKKGKDLDFSRGQIVGVRLDVIAGKMIFIPDREPLEHGTQGRKNGRVAGFGMKNSPARTRLEAAVAGEAQSRSSVTRNSSGPSREASPRWAELDPALTTTRVSKVRFPPVEVRAAHGDGVAVLDGGVLAEGRGDDDGGSVGSPSSYAS